MTADELDRLNAVQQAATPGPWFAGRFDDEHFMTAISIEACLADPSGKPMREVVAATLIQQPPYVVPSGDREMANAELIVEMRNALPELLRLAVIGLASERSP